MGLRDIGATLPPGFRFYPSDEELVCHYLYKKIANEQVLKGTFVDIDLHTCEPWQLPEVAKLNPNEWYFFNFRDRKYATGNRTNRATMSGYWKATGKDRMVVVPGTNEIVGMRKTLVFYRNRAPNGIKTGWIMHEFRIETPHLPPKEDWVLCRVFHKSRGDSITNDPTSPQLSPNLTNEDQTFPCVQYTPIHHPLPTNSAHKSHNQSFPCSNLLQYSQDMMNISTTWINNNYNTEMLSSKDGLNEFDFLWDMNMEEINGCFPARVADSNIDEKRFEICYNIC